MDRAYDSQTGHQRLAQTAIEAFNLCVTVDTQREYSLASYEIREYAGSIIEADVAEDEERLLRRATNWHFYRAGGPKEPCLVDRSLDRVFSSIASRIEAGQTDAADAYELIGRAMHFIEDMTVPAHVVPVTTTEFSAINQGPGRRLSGTGYAPGPSTLGRTSQGITWEVQGTGDSAS